MSDFYITYEDRLKIKDMLSEKKTVFQIAEALNKTDSTIYRELKRCKGDYDPDEAQQSLTRNGKIGYSERLKISEMLNEHKKPLEIARQIGVAESVVRREMARCDGNYDPDEAQRSYNSRVFTVKGLQSELMKYRKIIAYNNSTGLPVYSPRLLFDTDNNTIWCDKGDTKGTSDDPAVDDGIIDVNDAIKTYNDTHDISEWYAFTFHEIQNFLKKMYSKSA